MAKTIQLEGLTVTAIHAVWDGKLWHLRLRYEGGVEDIMDCLAALPQDATDMAIIGTVASWLDDNEVMGADDAKEFLAMIEVKR